MPEFLPVPMQSDDTTSSTNSVTPYPISSDEVSLNPVSQLHELLMKELNTLPVYAERVSAVGKYTEYECVVSGVGLSAKGRHLLSPCRTLVRCLLPKSPPLYYNMDKWETRLGVVFKWCCYQGSRLAFSKRPLCPKTSNVPFGFHLKTNIFLTPTT